MSRKRNAMSMEIGAPGSATSTNNDFRKCFSASVALSDLAYRMACSPAVISRKLPIPVDRTQKWHIIQTLPFISSTNPMFKKLEVVTEYVYPDLPCPTVVLTSRFCNAAILCKLSEIPGILKEIYDLHLETGKPLYIQEMDRKMQELVTKVSAYSHGAIPYRLAQERGNSASLTQQSLNQLLAPEHEFVITHMLYHFRKLFEHPNLYQSNSERELLFRQMCLLMTPDEALSKFDFPFVVEMTVETDKGPFKKGSWVFVSASSTSRIMVMKDMIIEPAEYGTNCSNFDNRIIFHLMTRHSYISLMKGPPKATWSAVLDGFSDIKQILVMFKHLGEHPVPMCASDRLALVFMTEHQVIFRAFLNVIIHSGTAAADGLKHLGKIYAFQRLEFRFLKSLIENEFRKCREKPEEIFRDNSPATLYLIEYMKAHCSCFLKGPVADFCRTVLNGPNYSYREPGPQDVEIIAGHLENFWDMMISTVDAIPINVRCILRVIRTMAEMTLFDKTTNHLGMTGIFFLRIIASGLSNPASVLGITGHEPASVSKSISLGKAVVSSATLDTSYMAVGKMAPLNDIFEKCALKAVQYLEEVSEPCGDFFQVEDVQLPEFLASVGFMSKFMRDRIESSKFEKWATEPLEPSMGVRELIFDMFDMERFN